MSTGGKPGGIIFPAKVIAVSEKYIVLENVSAGEVKEALNKYYEVAAVYMTQSTPASPVEIPGPNKPEGE